MIRFFQFISSFDDNLANFIELYGVFIYIALFFIIYSKTAFVVLTFLPGDALVFASGALTAIGKLDFWILLILFISATIAGDSQNYLIGNLFRRWHDKKPRLKNFLENTLQTAQTFVHRYGSFSILVARFVPLMRTTVPLASGLTQYCFSVFLKFNSLGAILWASFWLSIGYVLGNIEWIENNLVISLTMISFIPLLVPTIFVVINKLKKTFFHNTKNDNAEKPS
ncbi:DedA family protein [Rummeliibacillus suwonensis]|jgi:membrane-associated protein|uniref:DedA family protein n=1 Tax=Rummeliibacillus suwonensis TaxID=1306154 RepID=UPI0011B78A0D|nr:VTT domain-containing protein [Rummeliibacillus suwonensis]MBO2537715.1 VTT domain-containing protein [Rummeliibacillus suwonensis]